MLFVIESIETSSTTITITVAEIFDADNNPEPLTFTKSFILKIEEAAEEETEVVEDVYVPPIIVVVEDLEETTQDQWVPEEDEEPFLLEIKEITVLGLVYFQYNKPRTIDFITMVVAYDQRSYEAPISFSWNLTGSSEMAMSFEVQLNFSKPLSVSVGQDSDRLVVYVDAYDNWKNMTQHKVIEDIPMLIGSAEELA